MKKMVILIVEGANGIVDKGLKKIIFLRDVIICLFGKMLVGEPLILSGHYSKQINGT